MSILVLGIICIVSVKIWSYFDRPTKSVVDKKDNIVNNTPKINNTPEGWKMVSENTQGYELYQLIDNRSPSRPVELKGWNTTLKSNEDCIIELNLYSGETLTIKYDFSDDCMYVINSEAFSGEKWLGWQENLDNSETIRFLPLDNKPLEITLGRSLDGGLSALK